MDDSSMEEELDVLESKFSSWLEEKTNLIGSLIHGKKVLEVGCGTGNLIQFLSKRNLDLSGSDYSSVYLEKAKRKNLTVKFFQADLLDKNSWNKYLDSFDTVIASEVIEHIEDDLKALKTIHNLIKTSGVLILTVPAFNSLYSPLDKKIGHIRRYSKKSISSVIEKAGFKIEEIRYWNLLGLLGWFITFKILKKDLKDTGRLPIRGILSNWLKIEKKIHMPIGLTIVVRARKIEK